MKVQQTGWKIVCLTQPTFSRFPDSLSGSLARSPHFLSHLAATFLLLTFRKNFSECNYAVHSVTLLSGNIFRQNKGNSSALKFASFTQRWQLIKISEPRCPMMHNGERIATQIKRLRRTLCKFPAAINPSILDACIKFSISSHHHRHRFYHS